MVLNVSQCFLMVLINSRGFQWFSQILSGSCRFSLVLNVSQCFLLVLIGSQCSHRFSVVLSCYRMFSVVFYCCHGSQWFL